MEWGVTAAAVAETELSRPYIRVARQGKLKCHPYSISLTLAHILKVYEITYTARISHVICLIARNAGLTYKLFFSP